MALRRKYIELTDHERRNFVKWTLGVGAALGLKPWKVFEVNEDILGPAHAQSAATVGYKHIHLDFSNGGLSWMTQMFPHTSQANDTGKSFYKTGQALPLADSNMLLSPDLHMFTNHPTKSVQAIICGNNETHTGAPNSVLQLPGGSNAIAYSAALMMSYPVLIPSVAIGQNLDNSFGAAPGAPTLTSVASADDFRGLFAQKSRSTGYVLNQDADNAKYGAYYRAMISLWAASKRATFTMPAKITKSALNIMSMQLADALAVNGADLNRYGVDVPGVDGNVTAMARAFITVAKAFSLNLVNQVVIRCSPNDPHQAFADGRSDSVPPVMSKVMDSLMDDLMGMALPGSASQKLGDQVIISASGDTYKNPNDPNGWGDGTPNNSNILYIIANKSMLNLKGWAGTIADGGNGTTLNQKFNPLTNAAVPIGMQGVPSLGDLARYAGTSLVTLINGGKAIPSLASQLPLGGSISPFINVVTQ
jgi:hypothetical protein